MAFFLVILGSYLLGSISFGIIITRLVAGKDIRDYGSGSTGMTNVLRTVGKGPAALVLIGDALKGAASVTLGNYFGGSSYAVLGGLVAMGGHSYPIFHGFRGGKGVATGFGVIIALAPDVTVIALLIFLAVVFLSRYVSLGSILAAISVPILMIAFHKPLPLIIFGLVGAAFVLYSHRANMKRLWSGTEFKIGQQQR